MISRSSFDSKIGLTICSPHCSERFEATREPVRLELGADRQKVDVVLASGFDRERRPGGRMRVGDHEQIRAPSMPFSDSGMRVMLLLACPCTNIARTLSFCVDLVLRQDSTASNQRVERDTGRFHDLAWRRSRDCRG